jgi:hypothetical protein
VWLAKAIEDPICRKLELAREFDAVHSVARAKAVGSLDDVISPEELRSRLIAALG